MADIDLSGFDIDIRYFRDFFANATPEYDLFHNYYVGLHEFYFNKFYKHPKLNDLLKSIKSNVCKSVIDLIIGRLNIVDILGIEKSGEETLDISLTDDVSALKGIFSDAIKKALIYGDSYVTVWNGELHVHSPLTTAVKYDGNGEIISALSYRPAGEGKFEVYYFTFDYVFSGIVDGPGLPDKFEPLVAYANPLHPVVPIIHFFNDSPYIFRRSELLDVIPLQRVLNKTLQDRSLASELSAFKQKWVTGLQYDIDENGKPIPPFESDIAKIFVSTSENTKFGEFGETDLDNYTKCIDSLHQEISMVSGIPLHLFNLSSGNFPSGEALKTAEEPFVNKIIQKQRIFEIPIKRVLSLLYPVSDGFKVIFGSPSPESMSVKLDNALKKLQLGIDKDIVLKELGY